MPTMGRYCKAYPLSRMRSFCGWTENAQNARVEEKQFDGQKVRLPRELTDTVYVYLHENLTVTDGIFLDENIIFSEVTSAWEDFCRNELNFRIPDSPRPEALVAGAATD